MSYLTFQLAGATQSGKTNIWNVLSADSFLLGRVSWYGAWRKYTFKAEGSCVFDASCLREIANFCETSTREHQA